MTKQPFASVGKAAREKSADHQKAMARLTQGETQRISVTVPENLLRAINHLAQGTGMRGGRDKIVTEAFRDVVNKYLNGEGEFKLEDTEFVQMGLRRFLGE